VAPLFAGEISRKVILPQGKWYDFYTGDYVGEGEVVTVTPGLDKIPVFVKDGGIIPMMPPALRAPAKGESFDLEICHYGTKENTTLLYDDDGETYDYEKGEYSWRELKAEQNRQGKWKGFLSKAEKGKPDNIGQVTWRFMSS
jgi:alpha-D-xyloside xylohydrolase